MFTVGYDNGINGNLLILEGDIAKDVGYKSRMLVENDIKDFLRCSIIQADGKDKYVYDITSLISLYDLLDEEVMDHKFLCCLISGIAGGLESASEYLLPPCHLIFDPEHIYVDRERNRILWCYYPGSYTTLSEGMNGLAEYILKKADHKDDGAVALAYSLYKQVVNEDYTLRKLVSGSEPVTGEVSEDEERDEIYRVSDDKEFMTLKEDDAPVIPLFGKVIIASCILSLLLISAFTFTAGFCGSDSLKSLMELAEMKIFLALSGAVTVMMPLLIILKWYKRYRIFKKNMKEAGKDKDDVYMMISARDNNVQFGWEV